MTRKKFLKVTALSAAVAAGAPMLKMVSSRPAATRKAFVRIEPIPGNAYSPSFLRFCEEARFRSVNEAVRRVKDRTVEFRLVTEPV